MASVPLTLLLRRLTIGGAVISTMIFWYGLERPLAPCVWIIQRRKEAHPRPFDVDTIIDRIERRLGIEVCFPNPYAGERGIASN
jgi:hypothetical protein